MPVVAALAADRTDAAGQVFVSVIKWRKNYEHRNILVVSGPEHHVALPCATARRGRASGCELVELFQGVFRVFSTAPGRLIGADVQRAAGQHGNSQPLFLE